MKGACQRRCMVLACICVVGFAVYFVPRPTQPYYPPAIAFEGNSRDLRNSVVVPTLDTPVVDAKNIVWCGTMQLAWKVLESDLLHSPPDVTGAESVVTRLNRAPLREEDLPLGSYLATAGFVKDGIVDRVKDEMEVRFQRDVPRGLKGLDDGVLAFAYLQVELAFTVPFFENRERFMFTDSGGAATQVSSFGIPKKKEYAYSRLRNQIEVLYVKSKVVGGGRPDEFILDLCRGSTPIQIVIACVPPGKTLSETVDYVDGKIRENNVNTAIHSRFKSNDVLLVPNLNFAIDHRFAELEGAERHFRNPGFTASHIEMAAQSIRFRLDRCGAELKSEAKMYAKPLETYYIFDRPFLLFARKRGQPNPFFVLWVDNAELLSPPE